jgi:hypothetical protein
LLSAGLASAKNSKAPIGELLNFGRLGKLFKYSGTLARRVCCCFYGNRSTTKILCGKRSKRSLSRRSLTERPGVNH